MKCVIPNINAKVFGRAVHSLAKIGDTLYIEPKLSGVYFRTVNLSRSAFGSFHFSKGFFSHYDDGLGGQEPESDEDTVKCKIAMKAFLCVFKSLAAMERTVERVKISMDYEEAKLMIQLVCRYGIIKAYNLSFIECEAVQVVYDKNSIPNHVLSSSRVLLDAVCNFQNSQEEVTFSFTPRKAMFRNYIDNPDPSKVVHTELTLQCGEFEVYNIPSESEVTFNLKDLRAILGFTEPVNLPIKAEFSEPGNPIIFTVDNQPMFEGIYILATLSDKSDTQSTINSRARAATAQPAHQRQPPHTPSGPRPHTPAGSQRTPVYNVRTSRENGSPPASSHPTPRTPQPGAHSSFSNRNASQMDVSLPDLHGINGKNNEKEEEMEVIPGTPPAKRKRYLFKRCFESTYDPTAAPGYNVVYAEDSDEEG